ncbi:MAG: Regulatory protein AtoC [Phycisphaerae bacterium]|nr:Regulatory protein AtoC [Phycisphaerae bacterium]
MSDTRDDRLRVLVLDDEPTLRTLLGDELAAMGHATTTAATAGEAFAAIEKAAFDVALIDLNLPDQDGMEVFRRLRAQPGGARTEVIILTGHGTMASAIQAIRLGAFDYLIKPCSLRELQVLLAEIRRRKRRPAASRRSRADLGRLVGDAEPIRRVRELIARVAPADSTVLIVGPTGSGKELVAELIHANSRRADRPFVAVNATTLPAHLADSELFGHVRGAFTGADRDHSGLIATADGGTLFLDEIGDLPPELQGKLLRFLESGEIRAVGSTQPRRADVRVIAATHRDLSAAIARGTFREDLFYRLNQLQIETAPLSAMPESIVALAEQFLERANASDEGPPRRFAPATLETMAGYSWPGNVRELINAVGRARIMASGAEIRPGDLPEQVRRGAGGESTGPRATADAGSPALPSLAEVEREHIRRVLAACEGNKTAAARTLGISLRTLYYKLAEMKEEQDA